MRHEEVLEMLAWYANGTLPGEERRRVEQHLVGCPDCAAELAAYRAIRDAVAEVGAGEPAPPADLLTRALARVEAGERGRGRAVAQPAAGVAGPLVRAGRAWRAFWAPLAAPVRIVVATQAALILALGLALALPDRPDLTTLGGPGEDPSRRSPGLRLTVAFVEEASELRVRETLREVGGTIVAGPSAAAFYTVEVPATGDPGRQLEEVLARLRSRGDVIRFAEAAPGPP